MGEEAMCVIVDSFGAVNNQEECLTVADVNPNLDRKRPTRKREIRFAPIEGNKTQVGEIVYVKDNPWESVIYAMTRRK